MAPVLRAKKGPAGSSTRRSGCFGGRRRAPMPPQRCNSSPGTQTAAPRAGRAQGAGWLGHAAPLTAGQRADDRLCMRGPHHQVSQRVDQHAVARPLVHRNELRERATSTCASGPQGTTQGRGVRVHGPACANGGMARTARRGGRCKALPPACILGCPPLRSSPPRPHCSPHACTANRERPKAQACLPTLLNQGLPWMTRSPSSGLHLRPRAAALRAHTGRAGLDRGRREAAHPAACPCSPGLPYRPVVHAGVGVVACARRTKAVHLQADGACGYGGAGFRVQGSSEHGEQRCTGLTQAAQRLSPACWGQGSQDVLRGKRLR